MVGAINCSDRNGKEICAISGFNIAMRAKLSEEDLGRAVEVAYKGIATNGRLRMPRFKRWRDDIDPLNVDTLEEVEG